MPVLPLRQLEILYYFYIEIYIEIKFFFKIISFRYTSQRQVIEDTNSDCA